MDCHLVRLKVSKNDIFPGTVDDQFPRKAQSVAIV
jgi:hypothetical protein